MTIADVIDQLLAIKLAHGDLEVLVEEELDEWIVESIQYNKGVQPHLMLDGKMDDAIVAPHVTIRGGRRQSDLKGGWT